MAAVRNILFIMCDQLRADHLGCYGHPHLATRNLDALARRGVRFERAFVQSGVCGPSRMSFYTGRYVASHGATWNRVPLSVGEITLGEYLRDAGRALALAGKTHVVRDDAGLARLELDGGSELGRLLGAGGFAELDRHDGHQPEPRGAYAAWLRARGYDSADPWTDYVISATDGRGRIASGWNMRNAGLPARVAEAHSETAYTTDRALDFFRREAKVRIAVHHHRLSAGHGEQVLVHHKVWVEENRFITWVDGGEDGEEQAAGDAGGDEDFADVVADFS